MNIMDSEKLDYVFVLEELPQIYSYQFANYLDRAKALVDLPPYEIHLLNDVASTLSKILEQQFGNYLLPLDNPKSLRKNFLSFAELLYKNPDTLNLLDFGLKNYQYFGILALIDMSQALFFDSFLPSKQFEEDWAREDEVLSALCSAVEAVSYGETLHPSRLQLGHKDSSVISRWAKKGSDKRHEPARKIKIRFIRAYDKQKPPISKRKSAKEFFKNLSNEDKRILCPSLVEENAVRTLLDYLRAYENKISQQS